MRLLAKEAADRPQSADEVLRDLDAAATSSEQVTSRSAKHSAGAAPPHRPSHSRSRLAALGLAGVLLLGGLLAAVLYGARSRAERQHRVADVSAAAPSASGPRSDEASRAIRSVAVLPLVNVGGDTADEYFSDGMTDELADALAKVATAS
jgi:serine/threonine-protein kinase